MNKPLQANPHSPLLDFDSAPEAVINPGDFIRPLNLGQRMVLCFFPELGPKLVERGEAEIWHRFQSEAGERIVYKVSFKGQDVGLHHPGIGAPFAATSLENMIALGFSSFIACGACGVLDGSIPPGNLILPAQALRDEGTSHHYLAPSQTVSMNPQALEALRATLNEQGVSYLETTSWTTDALYRETQTKVALRKEQGCGVVEMEASALFAVAAFRKVPLGLLLYGGDDVSGEAWDQRQWRDRAQPRETVFRLALDACLKL